jgi:membrane associated rhomboid family serine protease
MGIYDREYYREEPRGFFLGGDRSMVTNLIIVNVAIFLADVLLFDSELSRLMGLKSDLIERPWNFWQLLTYGFAHSPEDAMHVAFNMLFLWFLGREVEHIYGRRAFLQLYLSIVVMAGLCWVLLDQAAGQQHAMVVGASGAVFGVMVVFALHYPMRTIYIFGIVPAPVWVLVALFLFKDIMSLRSQMRGDGGYDVVAHSVHLAGALFGFVFYKTGWTLARLIPDRLIKKGIRVRPKLRLHTPEQDDNELDTRVDQILDKINREGESSLTKEERRVLEEASRRYQRRRS